MTREKVEIEKRKSMTPALRSVILARQSGNCARCGETTVWAILDNGVRVHGPVAIDHVLPLELGGADDQSNMQALCLPCHKAKTRDDIRRIAKAKRLEKAEDPETRRKSPRPLKSRKEPWPKSSRKLRSRGFEKRRAP